MSAGGPESLARVVVVDDDRMIRELLRSALADRARVECCENAEAALEALHREPADLVIADLTMPGLSGIELLDEVRLSHPDTEFVLITGSPTVESAIDALRMGAANYLTKPLREDELQLAVDRILTRRRLIAENERLRTNLRAVDACQNLMRCLEPGEVYAVALDLLLQILPRRRGLGLFHRSPVPASDGVAFRGFSENEARRLRDALVREKPVDIDSISELRVASEGAVPEALAAAGAQTDGTLVVPVRGGEREMGVLWILEDGRPFEDSELENAALIAGHARLALRNAERYSQAKERAFIDDVTEAYNARYLLQAADHEIQRAERYGTPLTLLFLDLDRFKLVNDRFGHLVGSRSLRRLSELLGQCIRQVDSLARYGGDEFTILLVDTDHASGMAVAERIRRAVADARFEAGRETPFRLSISIGVASYPDHAGSRNQLLDVADKAMYRAKSLGRDCVCSAADLG